jgi:tetratricopeptide (TPR) repeat protein
MKSILLILFFCPLISLSQTDFEKAEKLFANQKFSEAKPFFENDLKQNPDHYQSVEYLGDIGSHLQKWETAVSCYQKLKSHDPKNADYQYKYGGALAMLAKDANKVRALTMIGDIESAFQKAIANNPKHIEARWALVELYLQLPGIVGGSEQKANRYANELAGLSAVDGYLSKGRIAEYFERFAAAEKYYRKAIEIGNSKTSNQKLADLYKNKMHQPEKAKAVWDNYNKTKG